MEHFLIIVNGWKSLTIITKSSILDVAAVRDPSLIIETHFIYLKNLLWRSSYIVIIFHHSLYISGYLDSHICGELTEKSFIVYIQQIFGNRNIHKYFNSLFTNQLPIHPYHCNNIVAMSYNR